ncbi:DinB family protein [Chitinophaga arvensicola]|nr:DinB family protein [Chitinophaga arvensicola]
MPIHDSIIRLNYLCNTIPALLTAIPAEEFSFKPAPGKWSKKEMLGHLVDSATNNHQRFVRTQFETTPTIGYDQNKWNQYSYYLQIDNQQLIDFWTLYNRQLLHLMQHIPEEALQRLCRHTDQDWTLDFIINDYVVHLEHHLKQMVTY